MTKTLARDPFSKIFDAYVIFKITCLKTLRKSFLLCIKLKINHSKSNVRCMNLKIKAVSRIMICYICEYLMIPSSL